MDAELRAHLQMLAEEYVANGMDRASAEARASREFGAVALAKDECRDARRVSMLDDLLQDARYALRSCRRNPGFTAVAVLTLALGIGANTALFSVVSAVLLRPLPFPDADRLMSIWENVPATETPLGRPLRQALPAADLRELRTASHTLSNVEPYGTLVELRLRRDEDAEIGGARISASTLSLLGARTQMGRLFNAGETAEMKPVVVLSSATWRQHFASDTGIVGRAVTVEGTFPPPYGLPRQIFTVVGVMADDFRFPSEQTGFWIPLNVDREGGSANIAQLRPGVARTAAAEEVNIILQARRPTGRASNGSPPRFEVVGLQDELVASVRPVLRILLMAAALVLLIVCSNVANLLLARATVRAREVSLRMALGAGRGRILRQMMTEGTVLAFLGGVAGTFLALAGVRILRVLFENLRGHVNIRQVGVDAGRVATFPRIEEIGIDVATLAFTAGVCVLAGVFFGLAPALRTAVSSLSNAMRDGSASAASGFGLFRRHATRSLLVVGQVALAVTLLVGGGLVVRSFLKLVTTDPGFQPSNVLTFQLRFPKGYPNRQVRQLSDQLVERAGSLPGARGAAYGILPLVSRLAFTPFLTSPSEQLPPPPTAQRGGDTFYTAEYPELRLVSRDYLRVMGMRVVAGRGFEAGHAGQSRGLIINETLARRRFPGQSAVGREVYFGADSPWQIIGVVADVRQQGLDVEPTPQVFADFGQWDRFIDIADDPGYYAIKTDGPPSPAFLTGLRDIVQEVDRQTMLDNVATMQQLVDSSIARPRLYAILLGLFATVAVLIAAVGVYGVMAYAVAQNTREIGVRMALGARASEVRRLVMGRAAALTSIGMALGFGGALAVSRFMQTMIVGLPPHDLLTYAAVAVGFGSVALLAAYVPAVRATRVNPLSALRAE